MRRKGLGKGLGQGYRNLVPMDSYVHSLAAKGIKTWEVPFNSEQWGKLYVKADSYEDAVDKLEMRDWDDKEVNEEEMDFDAEDVMLSEYELDAKGDKYSDYMTYDIYRKVVWAENSLDDEPGDHFVSAEIYVVPVTEREEFGEFMADEYGNSDYSNKVSFSKLATMSGGQIQETCKKQKEVANKLDAETLNALGRWSKNRESESYTSWDVHVPIMGGKRRANVHIVRYPDEYVVFDKVYETEELGLRNDEILSQVIRDRTYSYKTREGAEKKAKNLMREIGNDFFDFDKEKDKKGWIVKVADVLGGDAGSQQALLKESETELRRSPEEILTEFEKMEFGRAPGGHFVSKKIAEREAETIKRQVKEDREERGEKY